MLTKNIKRDVFLYLVTALEQAIEFSLLSFSLIIRQFCISIFLH